MLRSKIEPIADWVTVTLEETLSPAARSDAIADAARENLAEAQDINRRALGRIPPHDTFVDGRRDAPLESVRPKGGTIVFEFELVSDVLNWIALELVSRSPARSGKYRSSHRLFADGREVGVESIPEAAEYSFTNTVPYARKIEIGRTEAGRAFVIQVENRIYERTARDARARFGNIAKIGFTFRSLAGGRGSRSLRYPTITVTPN